ncbi:cAMP-specific 3',5'-cyclic phosphodiesterase 4D [Liparis tanakae]|uniref:cAMP-specific 3',5'-cyclic phosphodiesterase 4D n=1 Tax=Liparis tanakae TaxID=230148 RepID=A0A4Z2G3G8_9TELE|nr:cAMP-specific 3',5'-cyclic phosphodiesterase 4D [Liparis tanakae]
MDEQGLYEVSDDSSDSLEPGPVLCLEPYLVRRLSCRTVQLPPLAFRQAEQYYCDRKSESDTAAAPARPTTLPLRTPPLIAITSADTSRAGPPTEKCSVDFVAASEAGRHKVHTPAPGVGVRGFAPFHLPAT